VNLYPLKISKRIGRNSRKFSIYGTFKTSKLKGVKRVGLKAYTLSHTIATTRGALQRENAVFNYSLWARSFSPRSVFVRRIRFRSCGASNFPNFRIVAHFSIKMPKTYHPIPSQGLRCRILPFIPCYAGHPSYDDVTAGRQNICRRRTACLEQPFSCHP